MPIEYSENVGIAFGVVAAAGLSTAIGSSVVFFPSLVQYANRKTLASGLGLSAGVMTYVSFVEIFQKSVDSFIEAEFLEKQAYFSATLCFFAGIILMVCLNLLIHGVASHNLITKGQYGETDFSNSEASEEESVSDEASVAKRNKKKGRKTQEEKAKEDLGGSPVPDACVCGEDAVGRLEDVHTMAEAIQEEEDSRSETEGISQTLPETKTIDLEAGTASKKTKKRKGASKKDKKKLMMTSLNTAAAIALHNFPEGLATFVATLQDPAVGAVLAIAIAIHNIPEGLCVSMPVYYATGNRWQAFTWGLVSGLSEPLAAFFGWIILASWMDHIAYAVLFGVVAGMMVVISMKELLPTAHRYDPDDSIVTNSFITGMAIMALSLVLFAQL